MSSLRHGVLVAACAALAAPAQAAEPAPPAAPVEARVAAAPKPAAGAPRPRPAVDAAFLEFLGEAGDGDAAFDEFLLSREFERAAQPAAARKAAKDGTR